MKWHVLAGAAVFAFSAAPTIAHAQIAPAKGGDTVTTKTYGGAVDFGYTGYPHYGLEGDFGGSSRWGIGARFETGVTRIFPRAPGYRLMGGFNYFPGGASNNWEINLNALDLFAMRNVRANTYLGTGLNVAHMSPRIGTGHTDLGLNLLAGIRLAGANAPFLETRLELGGGSQFLVSLGWMFK